MTIRQSRHLPAALLAVAAALTVAGCGGADGSPGSGIAGFDPCAETAKKQFVLNVARDRYLFLDLLPANVDINAFATAGELLDHLTATARAQNRDRFFSAITTISSEQQFFAEGTSVGFGITTSLRPAGAPTQLFVAQVFEGSAAADAGFLRGDEILAIGSSQSSLETIATLLARPDGISQAIGPPTAGLTRIFRVRTPSGNTVERTVTKREFALNAVPSGLVRTFPRPGLSPIGYLTLRTYVSTADEPLRNAFAQFRSLNITDIVVDLRYNGGGLVSTAELFMNLFAGSLANQVMYQTRFNRNYTAQQQSIRFAAPALPQAVGALRIAFITTAASASATELSINSLAPYAQIAIIGAPTFGKPVGQTAHDIASCDFRLRLVSFQTVNRDGYGDYFNGLPPNDNNYTDAFCAAADDLTQPLGSDNEASLREALGWISQNRCGATLDGPVPQKTAGERETLLKSQGDVPLLRGAGPLAYYLPGTF
ncbi:MAG: S41 family peptidase [Steroidobacteraceae bacterium]|nr:S41 family peptidase [Steroidobacteraceae bacterium]MDW8257997.1 S41 family peptidase [Gammaproteobacteria bacterium]